MKFNPKQHIIVDPNEQRWQQTILKRLHVVSDSVCRMLLIQ
jgi:hypothetical protein